MNASFDLVVIGAGPAGYTGAIRAAQLGLSTACIEREAALGGTCLRVGCIPSKAILESSARYAEAKHDLAQHGISVGSVDMNIAAMQERKSGIVKTLAAGIAGLFKKHKIARYAGVASFVSVSEQGVLIAITQADGTVEHILAKKVMIATGSREAMLKGVEVDGKHIGTSTHALEYDHCPKSLVVIGAGAIGLELGSVWARLGAQVTVLEYGDRILPGMDAELAKGAQRIYEKQGLQFKLGARVTRAAVQGKQCVVEAEGLDAMKAEKVLVAVGRIPNTDSLNLEAVGIALDARGRIPVSEHFETVVPHVFAVGDVIVGPMLAHKAEEEAVACVERIATGYGHVDYNAISYVVYTEPEVASVGKTEEQLKESNVPYKKGTFPFMANARARAIAQTQGFVKILAHAETDRILGVHILGPRASDLIAEAAAAIAFGASSEDIARLCHPHPTLSEVVKEAALAVDGRTLNL